MNFELLVLATLLDSDVDDEVVAINVQIIYFQHQTNKVRCLNCCHDHRHQPPQKWRKFFHNGVKNSIWNDYLKPNPLLGKEILLMICISCGRFEKLMQDVMGTSTPFFSE